MSSNGGEDTIDAVLASKIAYEMKKSVKASKYCVSVRCKSASMLYNYIVTERRR